MQLTLWLNATHTTSELSRQNAHDESNIFVSFRVPEFITRVSISRQPIISPSGPESVHSKCGHNNCHALQHPLAQFRGLHPRWPRRDPTSIPDRSHVLPKSTQKSAFAMTTPATTTCVVWRKTTETMQNYGNIYIPTISRHFSKISASFR